MPSAPLLLLLCAAFFINVLLTGGLRHYAIRREILDHPNERSSHTLPTPRGGGLGIVVSFLLGVAYLAATGRLPWNVFLALAGGGLPIAIIGWLDDRYNVSASKRALVHAAASAWALGLLGGMPNLIPGIPTWAGSSMSQLLGFVGLIWLINLYNFMDGIDGLSGAEAVFVGGAAGGLIAFGPSPDFAWVCWLLASVCAGFLAWNWPPAKIFMGDVASGFLGFIFGTLAISGARQGASPVWPWLILLGVFIVDTTVTLLRRMMRGERWYEAHRSHAFQHASRRYKSHLKVTVGVAALNLVWLLPWAWAAFRWPRYGFAALVVALLPLIGLARYFKAGQEGD